MTQNTAVNRKVTKAVIPAAGLGTRFLPATKAMPKEMLTVVNKPIIQYAIEEAYDAGIREFIIITGRGKVAMENHFDYPYELADTLAKKGKMVELKVVSSVLPSDARMYYTRQGEPLGLGHAVWCGHTITGNDPFAVLLPDDVMCCNNGNGLAEMIKMYEETGKSVVMCEEVPHERTSSYGILDIGGSKPEGSRVNVSSFVEKPKPEEAPSNLAVVGRYVLSPAHMALLAETKPGKGGEIQLTDAMAEVAKTEGYSGYISTNKRFDCGDKVGFQMANLYFAMQDPYISERLRPFINDMVKSGS
ncbi:MAG: UTP--glucose-1-phosphate uridylyltransferase [Pseudomonas fluorescens]|nr:MAG: UTP--glucose-1-phosphate uridylyltransferase [Pseudomonas fluorescens]